MSLFSATNQERSYDRLLRNSYSSQRDWKQWRYNKGFNRTRRENTWARKGKSLYKKFQGGIILNRCLRNKHFLSSDEYCVKETNEEKRKQRNIMARFIESWGLRGSVSSFLLHLPLHSSFHGSSLSPTFGQKLDRNVLLACLLYSRRLLRSLFGPLYVSGKLPTYPPLAKPTSTLTSHLVQNVGLGEE